MIKLFSLKQAKKDGESPKSGSQKKASAAQLRITKGKQSQKVFIFHNSLSVCGVCCLRGGYFVSASNNNS